MQRSLSPILVLFILWSWMLVSCGKNHHQPSDLSDFTSHTYDARIVRVKSYEFKSDKYVEFRLCENAEQNLDDCIGIAEGRHFEVERLKFYVELITQKAQERELTGQSDLEFLGYKVPGSLTAISTTTSIISTLADYSASIGLVESTINGIGILMGTAKLFFSSETDENYVLQNHLRQNENEINSQLRDLSEDHHVEDIDEVVLAIEYLSKVIDAAEYGVEAPPLSR